jgi:hypothetical protein
MSSEKKLADFRQWVIAVLNLLGEEPVRQSEYLHRSGVGVEEILLQFDDVFQVSRARLDDGSLTQEEYALLQEVNTRADVVNSSPKSIWTEAALRSVAEWNDLRAAARAAKSELEGFWNS